MIAVRQVLLSMLFCAILIGSIDSATTSNVHAQDATENIRDHDSDSFHTALQFAQSLPTGWYNGLPDCPDTVAEALGQPEIWDDVTEAFLQDLPYYHPGATHSFRSRQGYYPTRNSDGTPRPGGQHGQQCTYADEKLITSGSAAGTPDYWATSLSTVLDHNRDDVKPFEALGWQIYSLYWPPNRGASGLDSQNITPVWLEPGTLDKLNSNGTISYEDLIHELPQAVVGNAYSFQLNAVNDGRQPSERPATFMKSGGELPNGLDVTSEGLITGIPLPEAANTKYTFTIEVSFGLTGSQTYSITVLSEAESTPTTTATPTATPTPTQYDRILEGGNDIDTFTIPADASGRWLIVDPGGVDTLNFSRFRTPIVIDLRRSEEQAVGGGLLLTLNGTFENVRGTDFDDIILGNDLANHLDGQAGSDLLVGLGGNDNLDGRSGNNLIFGGDGDDFLNGGNDADTLHGEAGNDILSGGGGNDILNGGDGNDNLLGGGGDDILNGDEGDDSLGSGSGVNVLTGGLGQDSALTNRGDTVCDEIEEYVITAVDISTAGLGCGERGVMSPSGFAPRQIPQQPTMPTRTPAGDAVLTPNPALDAALPGLLAQQPTTSPPGTPFPVEQESPDDPDFYCPSSIETRLEVGIPGYVNYDLGLSLREQPDAQSPELAVLDFGTSFDVVGGPECANDLVWWWVVLNYGVDGWVSEGSSYYLIAPSDLQRGQLPIAYDTACPNALDSQLRIGQRAQVLHGNWFFTRTHDAQNHMDPLPAGTIVEILGGPICGGESNNILRWYIRVTEGARAGYEGWVAEASSDTRDLAPLVVTPLPQQSATPIGTPIPAPAQYDRIVNQGGVIPIPAGASGHWLIIASPFQSLQFDRFDVPITLDLGSPFEQHVGGNLYLTIDGNIENLRGTRFDDVLIGNDLANEISGGDGNDVIIGQAGDDELYGGDGNDALFGGAGDDILRGEEGNNAFTGGSGDDLAFDYVYGDDVDCDGIEGGIHPMGIGPNEDPACGQELNVNPSELLNVLANDAEDSPQDAPEPFEPASGDVVISVPPQDGGQECVLTYGDSVNYYVTREYEASIINARTSIDPPSSPERQAELNAWSCLKNTFTFHGNAGDVIQVVAQSETDEILRIVLSSDSAPSGRNDYQPVAEVLGPITLDTDGTFTISVVLAYKPRASLEPRQLSLTLQADLTTPITCENGVTFQTRLRQGSQAYVLSTPFLDWGVYDQIEIGSRTTLFTQESGEIYDVLEGPVCKVEGETTTLYWRVRNNQGLEGWTQEGWTRENVATTQYILAPYSSISANLDTTSIPSSVPSPTTAPGAVPEQSGPPSLVGLGVDDVCQQPDGIEIEGSYRAESYHGGPSRVAFGWPDWTATPGTTIELTLRNVTTSMSPAVMVEWVDAGYIAYDTLPGQALSNPGQLTFTFYDYRSFFAGIGEESLIGIVFIVIDPDWEDAENTNVTLHIECKDLDETVAIPMSDSNANSNNQAAPVQNCPGTLPSRMIIGESGQVTPGDANNLRDNPSTSARLIGQIPGGGQFTVLDGPVCSNEYAWWQVDYQGLVGWTVEGNSSSYWIEPLTNALTNSTTSVDAPATSDVNSCVVSADGPVNRRSGPGTTYDNVGQMTPGQQMAVEAYTISTSNFTWWKLTDGSWVRDDVVDTSGDCSTIPAAS